MAKILETIVGERRRAVAEAQAAAPEAELRRRAAGRERRDFLAALQRPSRPGLPAIIAELKRASPSAGRIREQFEAAALARAYERGGAAAISVLTEERHFEGKLEYLAEARRVTKLPLLRKDFIFSTYQIWEAAAAGADAVLLIAAMLDDAALRELLECSRAAGLAALCEAHDENEMARVIAAGAVCIGVNSRDLRTFTVDPARGLELGAKIPTGAIGVAESGLRTCPDLERAASAGYSAVLVGERLMRAREPGRALERLRGGFVKICGLTRVEDVAAVAAAGADAMGMVFAAGSPRRVTAEQAERLVAAAPPGLRRVGVFAGVAMGEVRILARRLRLDAVQLHGEYTPDEGASLAAEVEVWRALAFPAADMPAALGWRDCAARFVLDTAVIGGTGKTIDWNAVPATAAALAPVPVIVAGGLRPENVAEAIARSGTLGVDVASGVESAAGIKDAGAVARFVAAARTAFKEQVDDGN